MINQLIQIIDVRVDPFNDDLPKALFILLMASRLVFAWTISFANMES